MMSTAEHLGTDLSCFMKGFTEDIYPDEHLHAIFVRSPYAHAKIVSIKDQTQDIEGVVGVWSANDLPDSIKPIPCVIPLFNRDGSPRKDPPRTLLAKDKVRHQGEAVVMVVARSAAIAKRAAQAVKVIYEPLPAVIDAKKALENEAPSVWEDIESNICFDWEAGDQNATMRAMEKAEHIIQAQIINSRIVASPLETRSAVAWIEQGQRVLVTPTQGVHWVRDTIAKDVLGWDPCTVSVFTPRVGGSFGTKIFIYPEQVLVLWAAQELTQAVKWVASREEAFVSDTQGRDHQTVARLALDSQGKFLALETNTIANLGAFLSNYGPFNATECGNAVITGAYKIGSFYNRVRGVMTNTAPVDSYRGAGRPEANNILERIIDIAALELGLDKAELRQTNLIQTTDLPFRTLTNIYLKNGAFANNLDTALEKIGYTHFKLRQQESLRQGKLRGLGIANFLETNGGIAIAKLMQPDGIPKESAYLTFNADGRLIAEVGTQCSGQGQIESYTLLLSEYLHYQIDDVEISQGSTLNLQQGTGTGGSKSLLTGSSALLQAADESVQKARLWLAQHYDWASDKIGWQDGFFHYEQSKLSLKELAIKAAAQTKSHPFEVHTSSIIAEGTFGNGCHICEIELDPETGQLEILRYITVNDFGHIFSAKNVKAQVIGGVAQGIGQAVLEECIFSSQDTPVFLNTDLGSYHLPQASHIPHVEVFFQTDQPGANALGIKGCGESGISAATPALMNALQDALSLVIGEKAVNVQMPATAVRLWSMINCKE
ncbi:MAG TPA: xanthine dehydrogenase family protein molybdopterin-binding subunit [Candidatus Sphingobacterium stercoripullorum]|nr:xanthine dehydrogenase family protein molybdopterin-binding subunit [Candidatus Sphingobacterium stercoripullorum]